MVNKVFNTAGQELFNVLASLGTAGQKAFTNEAGTSVEWGTGIKIGLFTKEISDASGTQAITGVGFKPSHIILMGGAPSTRNMSIGFDNGTNHYAIHNNGSVSADTWSHDGSYSIIWAVDGTKSYLGQITTLGADGFTVTWTKIGTGQSGVHTIYFMAFR